MPSDHEHEEAPILTKASYRQSRQLTALALAIGALMLAGPAAAALSWPAPLPWGAWRTEPVNAKFSTTNSAIAVDPAGNAFVAWSDLHINLGYFNGVTWTFEEIIPLDASVLGLALDVAGRPHIAYHTTGLNPNDAWDLRHAWFDGNAWQFEVIDGQSGAGIQGQLRLGTDGYPRIAYTDYATVLYYAWKDAAGWHRETVAGSGFSWLGMDLDSNNQPHIARALDGGTWGKTGYWTRSTAGVWTHEIPDTTGGSDISIAVDGLDRPHISYRNDGESLGYARRDATGWSLQVIDASGRVRDTGIATDSQNLAHISYRLIAQQVRYARQTADTTWVVETPDRLRLAQGTTHIAMDGNAIPHILYRLATTGGYAYAEPLVGTVTRAMG